MILRAIELSKRYGNQKVIDKFSYEFRSGNQYAITGPNGSGKSTLLSLFAGVLPPSKGKTELENNTGPIDPGSWYKQMKISAPYMDLIEDLSICETLEFYQKFKSLKKEINCSEFCEFIELKNAGDKLIKELSSGMVQRVKLGLAFLAEGEILLLDEPCSNLDKDGFQWYSKLIKEQDQQLVIIFSNDPREFEHCENVIDLKSFRS